MGNTVTWDPPTTFLGRNGAFKCSGVVVSYKEGVYSLKPLTSRGEEGSAEITFPHDAMPNIVAAIFRVTEGSQ